MNTEERRTKELYLAFYMGALSEDMDFVEAIPDMTDEELDKSVARRGELYGWG